MDQLRSDLLAEPLTSTEVRVLGCLFEKEVTTPDAYPLTLNAVVAACNQASGRAPVMSLTAPEVETALRTMKERMLVRVVHPSHGGRSEKHRQVAAEALGLAPSERAVLCLLALRGPQTPGELKSRSERLHAFSHLDDVQRALEALADRQPPLAVRLPRRLGQKELRWAHLLAGIVQDVGDDPAAAAAAPRTDRIADLEARVSRLELDLGDLRAALGVEERGY